MTDRLIKNTAASVRQKLLNKTKAENRLFMELLQYYAMERFLYRLSISQHANRFILKGALMLRVWRSPEIRPTMDIDMLGRTSNRDDAIAAQVRDMIAIETEPDGLVFDPSTIKTERIEEDADYEGVRIRFLCKLDTARINMQIDVGFSDTVFPEPDLCELPTVLNLPAPKLLCYSRESAIAEKFEAMVKLGELNSRMKDFYDIWLLSRQFDFDGVVLAESVRQTFSRRGTEMPEHIVAFTDSFINDKQVQWTAFCRRLRLENTPDEFAAIALAVKSLLAPVAEKIRSHVPMNSRWVAPGPWT